MREVAKSAYERLEVSVAVALGCINLLQHERLTSAEQAQVIGDMGLAIEDLTTQIQFLLGRAFGS